MTAVPQRTAFSHALGALAATGFCAIGPIERDEGTKRNKLENRYNELDDIVSTVGSSALALTIGSARCSSPNKPARKAGLSAR